MRPSPTPSRPNRDRPAAAPLRPPLRRPRRARPDRGARANAPRLAARRGRGHGRPVAAGAPWGVPARADARADRGPDGTGARDARQPRRRVVDATTDPVRQAAPVREIRPLLRRGPGADPRSSRGDHRERAHIAWRVLGLADSAGAGPRGEGTPPEARGGARTRAVRSRAAGTGAGAGGAPQRVAGRDL